MAKELVYNSKEYENISLFSNEEITNCQCTIRVNGEYEIHVSLFQALAFSPTISSMYRNDRTTTIFDIHMDVDGKLDTTLFTKIEEILKLNKIEILNENEAVNLAHFGRSIGNDIFIIPYSQYCNELNVEITKENAISLIQKKLKLFFKPEQYEEEIKTLAQNFDEISGKLEELSTNEIYFDIIESIIKSDHLHLPNEDFLLDFIIEKCNTDKRYETFFEYVLLEYCKDESIQRFLEYIEKIIPKDFNFNSIFSCLRRKMLTQKFQPNWDDYCEKRSKNLIKQM